MFQIWIDNVFYDMAATVNEAHTKTDAFIRNYRQGSKNIQIEYRYDTGKCKVK